MKDYSTNNNEKYYVFYDGECGFCNVWVQWILEHDNKNKFLFASLQSSFAQNFLKERKLNNKNFDTLYLWKPNQFYLSKSSAVLKIADILGGIYKPFAYLSIIPAFIRNLFYDFISTHRKKIIRERCFLPNAEQRKKFLEN